MQNYKICPHCGEVLRPGALTCTYCKQKVNNINPSLDIFEINKAEITSERNQNAKKSSWTSPAKNRKKQTGAKPTGKFNSAGKTAGNQKSKLWDSVQKTNNDREPDASRQTSQSQIWSDNQKKAWEAKKSQKQTKVYGNQRTTGPRQTPPAGRSSGKNDTRQKKKKKRIIILVIILIILSEIPWSTLGQQFYRLRFMVERIMEQTGIVDSEDTDDTTSEYKEDTAADSTFILKPSPDLDEYQMSSVRISTPKGYTLYLSGDDDSFLYVNPDSYSDTKLTGNFDLYPKSWEDQMTSDLDYLYKFDEYQNVTITEEQQCKTKAGTVSYIVATYIYSEDNTDTTECTCWLEYDENTLLIYSGMMNTIDDNPTDQIKTLFSTIE